MQRCCRRSFARYGIVPISALVGAGTASRLLVAGAADLALMEAGSRPVQA